MSDTKHVRIWRWDDAPQFLRKLFEGEDDVDWLALVPPAINQAYVPFMDLIAGTGDVISADVPDLPGFKAKIGTHS